VFCCKLIHYLLLFYSYFTIQFQDLYELKFSLIRFNSSWNVGIRKRNSIRTSTTKTLKRFSARIKVIVKRIEDRIHQPYINSLLT